MPLAHLIYASAATRRFAASDLRQLLVRARAHNVSVGVTGMLLHIDGSFFQVLEGEAPAIARLYRTIGADERHCGLTLIIDEPIARRSFGE